MSLLKEWQRDGLLTMPVIMMSGHATIDTAVEATRIGALNFLEKPIALQKLLKAVQQGLSHNREALPPSHLRTLPPSSKSPADRLPVSSYLTPVTNNEPTHGVTPAPVYAPITNNASHISFDLPLREARDAFERAYFEYHLVRENGSMTRVAEKTGLERTHLYRKLKQLGVEPGKLSKRGI